MMSSEDCQCSEPILLNRLLTKDKQTILKFKPWGLLVSKLNRIPCETVGAGAAERGGVRGVLRRPCRRSPGKVDRRSWKYN